MFKCITVTIVAFLLASRIFAGPEDLREVELSIEDEPEIGKAIYTVRFLPKQTKELDSLIFECVYRQEFEVLNSRGEKYTKVFEPEKFKYIRRKEKFVDDLDVYVNFRVPTSRERLEQAYGNRRFNKDAEIKVDRVIVTAESGGKNAWRIELKAGAVYRYDPGSGELLRKEP